MISALPARTIAATLAGMRAVGLDVERIATRSGLSAYPLAEAHVSVPEAVYTKLWREARLAACTDAVGVAAGVAVPIGSLGPVDYLASSVDNLGESIACTRDFSYLTTESSYWEVECGSDGEVVARFVNAVRCEEDDVGDEFVMGVLQGRVLAWASAPVPLVEVQLTRRKPLPQLEQRFAGCVSYGHANTQMILGRGAAGVPLKSRDLYLHSTIRALLGEHKEIAHVTSAATVTRRCVRELLIRERIPSLSLAASRIGVSARTLQRKLKTEGASYERIVDDARREASLILLRTQPELTILAVALEVGFADDRAFARAFRRWFGLSPRQWRNQQHDGAVV
jgi:AraC-like DNA-binding protein